MKISNRKKELIKIIFDLSLIPQKKSYLFGKFLIGESIKTFDLDRPLVDQRLRISDLFLTDIKSGIENLRQKLLNNNLKTLLDLIEKLNVFGFLCPKSSDYLKQHFKNSVPIYCRFILSKVDNKDNYFGDTQIVNQNGRDFILVTIYEWNRISYNFGNPIFKDLNKITVQEYFDSLKSCLQPDRIYLSNFVHEFQHAMQLIYSLSNSDNRYDLDGDLDKIINNPDNLKLYYSTTSEKEAFFIQILKFMEMNKMLNSSSYDELKFNFKSSMNKIGINQDYFSIFENLLKKYFQKLDESFTNNNILKILDKIGSHNKDIVLKRTQEFDKMSKEEFKQAFYSFAKSGVVDSVIN